jgi:hypothetical protein
MYEPHPAANYFPMFAEDRLRALADDIAANGLRDPIVLTSDGLLLDGRNRAAACDLVNVEPATVVFEGDPWAFVESKNTHRRDVTTGQKAMSTALLRAAAGRRVNGRWKRGTVDSGGSASSDWAHRMKEAGLVLDHAPDLADRVVTGDLTLDAAHRDARERRAAADADHAAIAALPDDLRILVESGVRTLADAEAEADLRNRTAAIDDDLAERVRAGTLAIDSAEDAMRERIPNRRSMVASAARAVDVIRRMAGHPIADLLTTGYRNPTFGDVDPLDHDSLADLRTMLASLNGTQR